MWVDLFTANPVSGQGYFGALESLLVNFMLPKTSAKVALLPLGELILNLESTSIFKRLILMCVF